MPHRIAFVRGANLNPWEMQNFSPLADRYDLVGFGSRGNNFDTSEIPFPVRKLFSVGQSLRARAPRALLERWWGDYHDLQGLERALEGFDIVHAAETMYYCSYQAALLKRRLGFKLAVTVWENIPFNYNTSAVRRIKETVFREADMFFAVSQRTRDVRRRARRRPEPRSGDRSQPGRGRDHAGHRLADRRGGEHTPDGRLLTDSLATYKVPDAMSVPGEVSVRFLEDSETRTRPSPPRRSASRR